MTDSPTVAELRTQAEQAGIDVPADAKKADIAALLEQHAQAAATDPDASPGPIAAEPAKKGERRKITHVTARGDWQDPFVDGDYLVFYGDERSELTGARRDGDEAVL